jgi:hypothetical protein
MIQGSYNLIDVPKDLSTLLRTVSLSNGRWAFSDSLNPSFYLDTPV